MAKIQAYSSVTVTDYSDVGQVSLYLTSNQPNNVIYDPNQDIFTPDWSASHLIITPVIAYNGVNVELTAPGLTVTYKRQEGSGTPTDLSSGESVSGNKLTVSANKLDDVTSKMLTYICEVKYTDPDTNVPLTTQATLTYSLIMNATEAKDASITGESVFLYDTNRQLVGSNTITLTANLSNVSVSQWQYKNASGDFIAYPTTNNTTISGSTLKVLATETGVFLNDKNATIKLVTSDPNVYDIHEVYKIYDGAAGSNTISAILSNDNHLVPVTADGVVRSWEGAETTIYIYEGGEDVSSKWNISVRYGDGLTGEYDTVTRTMTPTGLTSDASYAEFVCKRTGYPDVLKRYSITKQYAGNDGQDAVTYEVTSDVLVMSLNSSGVFNPTKVTFSAYKSTGTDAVKTNYNGRFIIEESTNGTTFSPKYTSGTDESTKTYTPSSNNVKLIRCTLYQSGSTSVTLDTQTVTVVNDGKNGQDGQDGQGGVSVVVTNSSDIIPCTTEGNAAVAKDIAIPFYGYLGIKRVPVTCTVGTLPSGVTVKNNTPGTASAGGLLTLSVASGATFGDPNLLTGDITLTFVCQGVSIEHKFTWTKNKQASSGENAVIFQLYSPDGGMIRNGSGTTTINTMMTSGTSNVNPTAFVWAKFEDGSYKTLQGQAASSLVVTADMVDGTSWFRCMATYGGKQYTAYWTVLDQSDPVMAYTYSTVSQFTNGQGEAAVYTRVYRNGEELDPIKSLVFSTNAPSGASAGDYYYHLDKTQKLCKLKKYSGTVWEDCSEPDDLNYEYYRINSKGVELDTTAPYKTGKCIYIDPSIINGQMQFRCKVEEK